MATTLTNKQWIEAFYVAYFGRPGDPEGVGYWLNLVNTGVLDLAGVAENFAQQAEATAQYALFNTFYNYPGYPLNDAMYDQFVTQAYQNMFNRAPDAEGKAYWINQLKTGAISPGAFLATVIYAAWAGQEGASADDWNTLYNKALAAEYFTDYLVENNITWTTALSDQVKSIIAAVDANSDPNDVNQKIENAIAEVPGQTFTLTEDLDNIIGTSGKDTINGTYKTLTLGDVIDGGAGTDTLYIGDTGSKSGVNFSLATIKNVENLIYDAANNAKNNTLDLTGIVGLQKVTYNDKNGGNGKDVTINTNGNATSVTVSGAAKVDISDKSTADTLTSVAVIGNSNVLTVTSDALTSLSLKDTDQNATVVAAAGTRTLNLAVDNVTGGAVISDNTATSVAITATGKASNIALTAGAATALNLAGDAGLTLAAVPVKVTSVTSTNTTGVTITAPLGDGVTFTGGDGKDVVTVGATTKTIDMGAGDDTVNVTAALGVTGKLVGGEGTDTLAMTSALAAALSANNTFAKAIDGFEVLSLAQTTAGSNDVVNLANLNNISYVKSAGTAAATGVAEVQSLTFTGADANGGELLVGGVRVVVPNDASAVGVALAVEAKAADIIAANPAIQSIGRFENELIITYNNGAGDVPNITVQQNPSGVLFSDVARIDGTNEVPEQQTVQITTAPAATGLVRINVLGNDVDFTVIAGQTEDQVAANMAAAIQAAGIAGVDTAAAIGDTVTIIYEGAVGNAPTATFTDLGGTGVTADVTDNAVPYVPPLSETQQVTILSGTDATGGEVVVAGARIALAPNLTVDEVGAAIAGAVLFIQGADPNIDGIAYDTSSDTLTFSYKEAAGNVSDITIVDNTTTGAAFVVNEVTKGVAGTPEGQLTITHMANNGTLELTGDLNGFTAVFMQFNTADDVFNLKLNGATNIFNTAPLLVQGVETINIVATDSNPAADPLNPSVVRLDAPDATKVVVSGNHGIDFTNSWLPKLVELDASGVNSTLATGAGAAAAVIFNAQVTDKPLTVTTGNGDDWIWVAGNTKGATIQTGAGDDWVAGSQGADVIDLGAGNDLVNSSPGADLITLGPGKDTYVFWSNTDSTISKYDTITDFQANTVGQGPGGAVTPAGAAGLAQRNGDVIDVSLVTPWWFDGIRVDVFNNAADATTFVANGALDFNPWVNAALDRSTNLLYIDVSDDGVVDMVIKLEGVTTINEAAFVI